MLPGLLTLIWTSCKKKRRLTFAGMSIQATICQTLGEDLRNLLHGPGERLTKIPTTTRPDYVWPEVWTKIGKASQNRENNNGQKRSQDLSMLEN